MNFVARGRWCVLLVVAASGPSLGAIVRTQARVETTVQELIDGAPGSVNADDGEFTADAADLPLSASATLTAAKRRSLPIHSPAGSGSPTATQ